jgi:hypothetical protein
MADHRCILRTKQRLNRSSLLGLLFFCSALSAYSAHGATVVTHHLLSQDTISLNTARLLFTMRLLRWPDGSRVRVFVLPDHHHLHREFAKQVLSLYPRQLRRVWDRHLFSGSGAIPIRVDSIDEMAKLVAETPGAIGYVPDSHPMDKLKVLHVK